MNLLVSDKYIESVEDSSKLKLVRVTITFEELRKWVLWIKSKLGL